jgi:pimeloyl-ACP methyl ester carboxylesterase
MAFERVFVDVAGVRTAYVEAGQGKPILLVPGGDHPADEYASDWDLSLAGLADDGFRVIAPVELGRGSPGPSAEPSDYPVQAVYDHLAAFTESLDLREVTVVGSDRGAIPSTLLALDHPERIRSLVIVDGDTIAPRPKLSPTGEIVATGTFAPYVESSRESIHDRLRAGELQTDTLIVWGRNDSAAPVELATKLFELVAGANVLRTELHVFNRCDHRDPDAHPRRFDDVLTAFARS